MKLWNTELQIANPNKNTDERKRRDGPTSGESIMKLSQGLLCICLSVYLSIYISRKTPSYLYIQVQTMHILCYTCKLYRLRNYEYCISLVTQFCSRGADALLVSHKRHLLMLYTRAEYRFSLQIVWTMWSIAWLNVCHRALHSPSPSSSKTGELLEPLWTLIYGYCSSWDQGMKLEKEGMIHSLGLLHHRAGAWWLLCVSRQGN